MTKRRLLPLLALVVLAAAALPALASVYQPSASDEIMSVEANGGAVVAVRHQCTGLGSSISVMRAGAPTATIVSCSKKLLTSSVSITVDHADGWLIAVWAQSNPFAKPGQNGAKLYAAVSHNGGRSFGKPELLHTLGGAFPAEVAAGAYAHRLWVLTAGFGKKNSFRLQQFDLRFHQGLPAVQGLANYHVLPSTSTFRIYAVRDGVVALWESLSGANSSWYAADTERINPTDMTKAVRFVPRGKITDQSLGRLFVGADGMLYRLREKIDVLSGDTPQLKLSLDRWYFKTHQFAPVGGNDGFLKEVPDASMSRAPVIAVGVGVDGSVDLLLAPIAKSQPTCLYNDFLACAVKGTTTAPILEFDRRDRAGNWTTKPVPLPSYTADENAVAPVPFGAAPWNLIVTGNSSALVDLAYAKATPTTGGYNYPYTGVRRSLELLR